MQNTVLDYFEMDIRPFLSPVSFSGGEGILEEGECPSCLYYFVEGRAKLFLTHENGRISLINFLDAPCFVGEMELIGAQKYANGVTAVTPCTGYRIDTGRCREQLLRDTRFLRYLCQFLGEKAIGNTANYSRNQSYPLENRLAGFILTTAQGGIYRERHTEAAEFLGVTYRHFLYVLAGMVKRGILRKTEAGYRIADREALEELARR